MKNVAIDQALFEEAVSAIPPDALSDLRRSAATLFAQSGFPTLRDEDWRYTNLSHAVELSNSWLATAANLASQPVSQDAAILHAIDAYWIRIHDGIADIESSTTPDGVTVTPLSASPDPGGIAVDDAMSQLNAALLTDGLRISVAAGTRLDKPIGFLHQDSSAKEPVLAQSRIVLDIQNGAAASFVEAHTSSGPGEHFANNVVQLNLAELATVDYVRIQQRARNHIQTAKLVATIADGAEFRHCGFDLGGSLTRNEIVAKLQGRNSSAVLNGLYLAGDQQHIDNHTRVDHEVGPSISSEEYRGILNRKSRCVWNGKAIVHKGADGADANQSNHNLLLSGDAEIDTKPELEIYADDVKCSHGATVGQMDESALFYLRSRGLDKSEATLLITRAFASKLISMMTVAAAGEYVAKAVDERLDTLIGDTGHE